MSSSARVSRKNGRQVYLVPAVGPFVPRGLAGVVHADDLLAFSQALEVPVGGGDPDIRAFAEAR